MFLRRSFLGVVLAALLAVSVASPAFANGKANWQTTFAGTAVTPGGVSFGFWGWCAFGGGVTSGTSGDCQFAEYLHGVPGESFSCEESLEITSWTTQVVPPLPAPQFVMSGTLTVHPTSQTAACIAFFPGNQFMTGPNSNTFAGAPSGIPAIAGHYNLTSGFLGPNQVGEFQIQVTRVF